MKNLILLLILVSSTVSFGQDFHYKIKVNGVTNLATAKDCVTLFRNKFENLPAFNDSTDYYDFYSNSDVSEEEILLLISPSGYVILDYTRVYVGDDSQIENAEE